MDLEKIIAQLRVERDRISETIVALERLAAEQPRKRGRPPVWLASPNKAARVRQRSSPGGRGAAAK
jgi:hypothetical protein